MSRPGDGSLRGMGLLALAGIGGYALIAISTGVAFAVPVGIVGAIAAAIVLRGPLGKAIARRLEGETGGVGEEVYAELDDLRNRVMELEERQDFTERLLTQARDSGRVPGHVGEPEMDR